MCYSCKEFISQWLTGLWVPLGGCGSWQSSEGCTVVAGLWGMNLWVLELLSDRQGWWTGEAPEIKCVCLQGSFLTNLHLTSIGDTEPVILVGDDRGGA